MKNQKRNLFYTLIMLFLLIIGCKYDDKSGKKTEREQSLISFNEKFEVSYTYLKKIDSSYYIFSLSKRNNPSMKYGVVDNTNNEIYKPIFDKIDYKAGAFYFLKNNILSNSKNKKIDNVIGFDLYKDEIIVQKENKMYSLCNKDLSYIMQNFKDLNLLKKTRSIMNLKVEKKEVKIDSIEQMKKDDIEKEESRKRILRLLKPVFKNDKFNYQIIQNSKNFNLDDIEYGLVMGVSSWSGFTVVIGSKVLNGISESTNNKIPLTILDYDFAYDHRTKEIFKSKYWKYPSFGWVENGKIIKRAEKKQDLEPFINFVKTKPYLK